MTKLILRFRTLPQTVKKITTTLAYLVGTFMLIVLIRATGRSTIRISGRNLVEFQSANWQLENAFPNLTFSRPVEFTYPNDSSNRVFVVEQKGRIRVFENKLTSRTASVYLDISKKVSSEGEMGLLGLAFHPDFKRNGYFYLYYTKRNPLESVIARYQATGPGLAPVNPSTETVILRFAQPYDNHNGGKIAFGPDGYLYVATGDGGAWGDPHQNAQNRASWLGKILRIDINKTDKGTYGIPADNPFAGNREAYREELFAYGLRNPWRFSFDRQTGLIWVGDVGQNQFEEVNIITKGGNYGWRLKEADICYNPRKDCDPDKTLIDPIHQYPREDGVSITGGVVYRGSRHPDLLGKYLYADFGTGKVWALTHANGKKTDNQVLTVTDGSISAFGEDAAGEVYLLDHRGTIKKFAVAH
jgi:glucose/arabinose dehydrogenase